MAKRKRLTLPLPGQPPAEDAPAPLARAPIAQVAGDAAAAAAFHDVAGELARAREDGRLVVTLPLEAVRLDHLHRDRLTVDEDEMAALMASLLARGQQTPIEVLALPDGGYGLISGWRRCQALRRLAQDDPARFGSVLALVRSPDSAAAAYRAMVEENEIRADLSFFERARVVARAVNDGAFADTREALGTLFAAASYAKRSKIKSFLRVVEALEGTLRHPTRLSEHLGLKLSKALAEDPALPDRIAAALAQVDPEDPAAETAALKRVLSHAKGGAAEKAGVKTGSDTAQLRDLRLAPGLSLRLQGETATLWGTRVSPSLLRRLEAWLRGQPEAR